jgi:hypothetical protein
MEDPASAQAKPPIPTAPNSPIADPCNNASLTRLAVVIDALTPALALGAAKAIMLDAGAVA